MSEPRKISLLNCKINAAADSEQRFCFSMSWGMEAGRDQRRIVAEMRGDDDIKHVISSNSSNDVILYISADSEASKHVWISSLRLAADIQRRKKCDDDRSIS